MHDTDRGAGTPGDTIGRRALTRGLAWTAPAVLVAAPARAAASSPQIVPGINGWNQHYYEDRSGRCAHQITVNSDPGGGPTPDGTPWGLYIYDVIPGVTTLTNAQIIYWIRGNTTVSWVSQSGHSSCWGSPTQGPAQQKSDGLTYTPYTWTYSCLIDSNTVASDGRLYLGRFHTRARFTLNSSICNDVCFWAHRRVTIDGAVQQFERKRGFRNCSGASINSVPPSSNGELQRQELEDEKSELQAELQQLEAGDVESDADAVTKLESGIEELDAQLAELEVEDEALHPDETLPG